ncbi:MAG: DUF1573 domain-containing protein [Patescibacteria group bacterium]|nr:DUF1573 domain-containing protein [Patescibacteria group bacterium]
MNNQELTKKEQYLLKKEQKNKEKLGKVRAKKNKKMIETFIVLGLIIAGIGYGLSRSSGQSQNLPKIEISPLQYDAGIVSMADGLVKKTFEIKNNGIGDLEIGGITTSCMCTTAVLIVDGQSSPEFGMHNNQLFWSQKISPDQTGYLDVVFDPNFHGSQGTGNIMRAVYLSTNDPQNGKAEARLIANVIP